MPADQKEIYYLMAPNGEAAESSPYFEAFRARKLEVLFLFDPWDEFVMEHLHVFQEKELRAAEKAEIAVSDDARKPEELSDEQGGALAAWMKEVLGDKVGEVRLSKRLVDSPALILDSDKFMSANMRKILKAAGKAGQTPAPAYDLEVNPRHVIIVSLQKQRERDPQLAAKVAEQILDNTKVAAGLLEDPRTMLARLNELLEKVLTKT